MSLVELKQYLMKVKIASLAGMALCFNREPETLRHMLQHWVKKGCVRQCLKTPACGTRCGKCSPFATEIYEWVQ